MQLWKEWEKGGVVLKEHSSSITRVAKYSVKKEGKFGQEGWALYKFLKKKINSLFH